MNLERLGHTPIQMIIAYIHSLYSKLQKLFLCFIFLFYLLFLLLSYLNTHRRYVLILALLCFCLFVCLFSLYIFCTMNRDQGRSPSPLNRSPALRPLNLPSMRACTYVTYLVIYLIYFFFFYFFNLHLLLWYVY